MRFNGIITSKEWTNGAKFEPLETKKRLRKLLKNAILNSKV